MKEMIIEEAKRCLQCKRPQCSKGCPIGTPVKEMITLLLEGQMQEAGALLFENNPLSIICSMICPHEIFCEGHCILGRKGKAVQVSSIANYISTRYIDRFRTRYQPGKAFLHQVTWLQEPESWRRPFTSPGVPHMQLLII